jgi:hypothetical protein
MKLCKDCRFVEQLGRTTTFYYCRHPLTQRPPRQNPVTGEMETINVTCDTERMLGTQCGPDGTLWQSKDDLPEPNAPQAGFV